MKKNSVSLGVHNKPRWLKEKKVDSEDGGSTSNKSREVTSSSFTESRQWEVSAAINNTFPRADTLTPLHLHFLPAILPG